MLPKLLFLIADGMGDWPVDALGGKTPLMSANTPHMDALAAKGLMGRCRTVPQGMPPGSDVANMALMGFDPAKYHTGRGPIEAAAQGLKLDPDDLVWRMNIVTVSEYGPGGMMRDYAAGHPDNADARQLVLELQKRLGNEKFTFYPGVQYRHLLVQRGGAKQPEARLDINPPHDILDKPLADDLAAYGGCRELNDLLQAAAAILAEPVNKTKANAVWPWGQGSPLLLPDFAATYGIRGAVVSAVDLVNGLGRAAGMEVLEVEGATGLLDTNYEGKVAAALAFLEQGDYVYLHVEAPDECGHAGNSADKIESIERFDSRILAPLQKALPDAAFVLTCDHFTPIVERTHVSDPVPFVVSWPGCDPNHKAVTFDERTAAEIPLLLEPGHMFMQWVLERLSESSW